MNRNIKAIFSLTAIGILTACSGNKVSEAKFLDACNKIEDHQYYQVTFNIDIDIKQTDNGSETNIDDKITRTYLYRYVYIEENDEWLWAWCRDFVWEDEFNAPDYESECLHLVFSLKNERPFVATIQSSDDTKVSTTYYTKPFKITTKIKGSSSGKNYTKTTNNKYNYEFDKYGYPIKYIENVNETYVGDTKVGTATIHRDQIRKGTRKITVTYSDERPTEE